MIVLDFELSDNKGRSCQKCQFVFCDKALEKLCAEKFTLSFIVSGTSPSISRERLN